MSNSYLLFFPRLQLYGRDLELEFSHFHDWLKVFPLYKGKANVEDYEEDEEERLMGKYKVSWAGRRLTKLCSRSFAKQNWLQFVTFPPQGSFLVYPIDLEEDENTNCQITKGIPPNSAIKVLVRVYIIKVSLHDCCDLFTSNAVAFVKWNVTKHRRYLPSLWPTGH